MRAGDPQIGEQRRDRFVRDAGAQGREVLGSGEGAHATGDFLPGFCHATYSADRQALAAGPLPICPALRPGAEQPTDMTVAAGRCRWWGRWRSSLPSSVRYLCLSQPSGIGTTFNPADSPRWPLPWLHAPNGPPAAVITRRWGSQCSSHHWLTCSGLLRQDSQARHSPVSRERGSGCRHHSGHHRNSASSRRTNVGANHSYTHSPTEGNCCYRAGGGAAAPDPISSA